MSNEGRSHDEIVSAWLKGAEGISSGGVLDLFEDGMQRMLRRVQPTLGETTLAAILARVLYTATERHPFLASLRVKTGGVDFDGVRDGLTAIPADDVTQATQFAMVEFLTVVGHLTAEILTPALHAVLSEDVETAPSTVPRSAKKTRT
jgi:hypothetical protein